MAIMLCLHSHKMVMVYCVYTVSWTCCIRLCITIDIDCCSLNLQSIEGVVDDDIVFRCIKWLIEYKLLNSN